MVLMIDANIMYNVTAWPKFKSHMYYIHAMSHAHMSVQCFMGLIKMLRVTLRLGGRQNYSITKAILVIGAC